jgi:hypothetical protein
MIAILDKFTLTGRVAVVTAVAGLLGAEFYGIQANANMTVAVVCRKVKQICTLKDGIHALGLVSEEQK